MSKSLQWPAKPYINVLHRTHSGLHTWSPVWTWSLRDILLPQDMCICCLSSFMFLLKMSTWLTVSSPSGFSISITYLVRPYLTTKLKLQFLPKSKTIISFKHFLSASLPSVFSLALTTSQSRTQHLLTLWMLSALSPKISSLKAGIFVCSVQRCSPSSLNRAWHIIEI